MSLRDDIEIERKNLGLSNESFCEVSHYHYKEILRKIWGTFTALGHKAEEYSWINHHLSRSLVGYQPKNAIDVTKILGDILPNDSKLWFIGQESKNGKPKYWLYESDIFSILKLLDQMYIFDYYIVNKKYKWLVSEEHHGVLLASGEPVASRLENYKY